MGFSKRIPKSDKSEILSRQQPAEFDVLWSEVQARISRALDFVTGKPKRVFSSDEYLQLYDTIFYMCPPYSAQLYEHYKLILQSQTLMALQSLKEKHDEFLLKEFVVVWENHQVMVRLLSKFFLRLDDYYIAPNLLLPLRELGVSCFHDIVFEDLKTVLTTTIVGMVNNERDGAHIDRALVKDVLAIYVHIGRQNLGLYMINFEQPFCKRTQDYYAMKAQTWMSKDSCAEYMLKVEESLQKEKERVAHYLHSSTGPKLFEVILFELRKHGEHILNRENSGCRELLLDGKHDDLSRIYWFFYMDGLSELLKIFNEHVKEEGISLMKHVTANDRKDFIHKVIQLHDKLLKYVTHCFKNDPAYHKVLTDAFIDFCNEDIAGSSCGELLAAFCDDILRNGGRQKLSDEAVEETLDKVLCILEYIWDKDIFLGFHRSRLAKRLLSKSCNYEYEQSLLSRLKRYLGRLCTKNMDAMLCDIATSKDHQTDFKQHMGNDPEFQLNVDLSVTVLRSRSWPSYKSFNINLPSEMAKCVEVFTNYYTSNQASKNLTWINGLGSCTIIVNFDSKPIELIVSTYQAALLLLFEQTDRLSYSDIVNQLNLPDADAVRVLQSFSCAKYRILNKEPRNMEISQSDIFHFNSKFTSKMRTIKVPLPSAGTDTVIDAVVQDRKLTIEACIVRVMKTSKVMSHQLLVEECVKQLNRKFQLKVSDFKKHIDNLITRGYMERDPENPSVYRYLAGFDEQ